jgi:nucleoside-diphosphate-sugar epimerase
MKILIFGGAGFIGHHLVNKLQEDHEVCVYDNFSIFGVTNENQKHKIIQGRTKLWRDVRTINGSIVENSLIQNTCNDFKPDIIVNLAAYPRVSLVEKYPVLATEGMIQGLINTLNYDVKKYIHISSSNVYGNYQDGANEESMLSPINLYGSLKLAQERLIKANSKNTGSNYVILRPMCVFGNYDLGDRLVPKFIKQANKNQEIFYATDTLTNITYVDDMTQAIKLSIENEIKNETFNISSGYLTDIKTLAIDIKNYYDSASSLVPVNREKYFPTRGNFYIEKAQNILGYKPQYDLVKALKEIDVDTIHG